MRPGQFISFKCVATGSPPPQVNSTLYTPKKIAVYNEVHGAATAMYCWNVIFCCFCCSLHCHSKSMLFAMIPHHRSEYLLFFGVRKACKQFHQHFVDCYNRNMSESFFFGVNKKRINKHISLNAVIRYFIIILY